LLNAAEYVENVEALEYAHHQTPADYINRRDARGWTPLQYCVFSRLVPRSSGFSQKVRYLLANGADPFLKCESTALIGCNDPTSCLNALEFATMLTPSYYNDFVQAMKHCGHQIPADMDEDPFEDAVEV
jgi:hypothetical protein